MNKISVKNIFFATSVLVSLSFAWMVAPAFADVSSTAVTSGSTAHSQGTKASEQYENEGRAGGPIYDYGKGIQIGPAHFIPSIGYDYAWLDNVFYDERGTKSDYVNRLNTDITGELPLGGGQHLISMSYVTSTEWFERFSSQDHTDQTVGAGIKLNYVPFSLNVEDHFQRTVDRSGTEFTARIPRDENTSHGLLEIPFSQFFLETEVFDLNEDYRNPDQITFTHNDLGIFQRAGIDISGNNQFLVEYGYKNIDYSGTPERNATANQFALGLRGNLTERVTYQIWGGAQYRIYDLDSLPDFNGFIMRGAFQYAISDTSHVALKLDRTPQESTFDNQSFYVRNRAEIDWRQQIAERIFFNTRESLDYNEYSRITVFNSIKQQTRRDYTWQAGAGLEYQLPNNLTSLTLDYRFNGRVSNLDGSLGYDAQEITAGIRTSF